MRSKTTTPDHAAATQRIALYRRVSSPGQVERDLSLPEQASQQRAYVAREGGIIVAEYEDAGVSGADVKNRPSFLEMIEDAKRGEFDVLLVHKSDRAFRNQYDAITNKMLLRDHGIRLVSVTEPWFGGRSPEDELVENVMASIAQWYKDNLAVETRKGIRSAASHQGRQQGMPSFGYCWLNPSAPREGWAVDEECARWVRRAFENIVKGASINDVCREFNTLGIQTGRKRMGLKDAGDGWSNASMRKMLTNRNYIGKVRYSSWGRDGKIELREEFDGAHAPIVDADLFAQVQQILASRPKDRSGASTGLYSGGLLSCPLCAANGKESPLHHVPFRTRQGEYRHRYQCSDYMARVAARAVNADSGRYTCHGFGINEGPVTAAIIAVLTAHAGGPRKIPKAADIAAVRDMSLRRAQDSGYQLRIDAARKELAEQPKIRERITWQADYISRAEYISQMDRLNERARELHAIIEGAEKERTREAGLPPGEAGQVVAFLSSDAYTVQQKRDLLRTLCRSITPQPDKVFVEIVFRASSR